MPPKWKTFLWRALNDILPVTTTLLLKRVEVDPSCPMCGLGHESFMHALVLCEFSAKVWRDSALTLLSVSDGSFAAWFSNLMLVLSVDNLTLIVAVLYHLWRARNTAVWDGCLPLPRTVLAQASSTLHAWREVHQHGSPGPPHTLAAGSVDIQEDPAHNPTALPQCYFDAAHQPASQDSAFAAVLLDPGGRFVAACAGRLPVCFSPLMAESMTCKEVLSWLRQRGVLDVHVFTDCA